MCAKQYKLEMRVTCGRAFLQPLVQKHRASLLLSSTLPWHLQNDVSLALQEHFITLAFPGSPPICRFHAFTPSVSSPPEYKVLRLHQRGRRAGEDVAPVVSLFPHPP